MKAMILAAGLAERMRPLTDHCPKALLPVGGKPIVQWQLLWLRKHGIREVVISLFHCGEQIEAHVGDGSRWGMAVDYLRETELLPTGDAIWAVGPALGDEFVVAYGDILTDLDLTGLLRFHASREDGPHATLALVRSDHPWDSGQVLVGEGGQVTRFAEKAGRDGVFTDWVLAGTLVLPQAALAGRDGSVGDIGRDLLPRLVQGRLPCYGWHSPERTRRCHVGSIEGLARAQAEWPPAGGR